MPPLVLAGLALACFGRLVAEPDALVVDGRRPSVDAMGPPVLRSLGNDLTRQHLPRLAWISARVARTGRLPQWDPSGFGGRPNVGNPQGGLFYPPARLARLAWVAGQPAALPWLTVAHLLWGGLGVYLLCRTYRLGRMAATLAAGCFQASPYVLAQAFEGHYPHVWAASWYPWAFWGMTRWRRGDVRGAWALPPILSLTYLTGHPQEWYYLTIALGGWAGADAVVALRHGQGHAAVRGLLARSGVMLLALGLVAIDLVPVLAAQPWTLRGGRFAVGGAGRYHVHPTNLLQLLSPRALGGPADYFGPGNYWEAMLAPGWTPLVLAVLALRRSPRPALVRGWAIVAALAVAFAAGRSLGLFAVLYQVVPGMDRFRVPSRALFLASLAGSILAGLGLEAVARPADGPPADWRGWDRGLRRVVAVLLVGLAVGVAVSARLGPEDGGPIARPHAGGGGIRPARVRSWVRWAQAGSRIAHDGVFWVALAGTTAGFGWLGRRPRAHRRVAVALGVVALAELGLYGRALLVTAPAGRFLGPDPIGAAVARVRPPGPFRVRARDVFYDDLRAARLGLEKTNVNDSFQIQHAADLYEALYPLFDPRTYQAPGDPPHQDVARSRREVRQGVLDRMGVALLITDRPEPGAPWPVVAAGTWDGTGFLIYRNPTALPRAYVVPRARPAPDDASAVALFAAVPPREAVLMPADPLGSGGTRQPFTPASYDATDPDRVVIQVTTVAPGLLVVADTWMPGWTAHVDGLPAPVLRGNRAQRVIPLPRPGRHQIVLRYRAPGFSAGLAITTVAGLVWLLSVVATRTASSVRRSAGCRGRR